MSSSIAKAIKDFPAPQPTNFSKGGIEKVAQHVSQSLGYEPGGDLAALIRTRMRGRIQYIDLDLWLNDDTDTIEVYADGSFCIFLSRVGGLLRNRFTLAHELGHYVLHSRSGQQTLRAARSLLNERAEWEANWFAAELLMPKKQFLAEVQEGRTDLQLSSLFLVSLAAIRVRREVLGR